MHSWKELVVVLVCAGGLLCLGADLADRSSAEWKSNRCQVNLAQVYKMAVKYQDDHNGDFVPLVDKTTKPWTFWFKYLLKYGEDPMVFYCPANPKAEKFFTEEDNPLEPKNFYSKAQSYGMNYRLSKHYNKKTTKLNIANVANPGKVLFFGDAKDYFLRGTKYCWKKDWAPRHEGEANFVFVDGSIKKMGKNTLGLVHKWDGWKKDTKFWKDWKKE
ncbi:MAG: hypothetical protein L3J71_18090 [Victivallaceae bacterium]|nr:hypothetical protein [Victivallaceae bacterium]